jgi:uncharacterized OsmC-like protein
MTTDTHAGVVDTISVDVVSSESRTKIVRVPVDPDPVPMGVHGAVAAHYKIPEGSYTPHATTLDYLVGAATACLAGTFGGRLGAIGQSVSKGELEATGEGALENRNGVLQVAAIHVRYRLALGADVDEDQVQRAHDSHARFCPVATSIGGSIAITTEVEVIR